MHPDTTSTSTTTSNMSKTVAFFGASGGVGLTALKRTLAAGHKAIALCRTPSKLTDQLPLASNPNLTVIAGDATDIDAVTRAITLSSGSFVDSITFTVGSRFVGLSMENANVCEQAMTTLLSAITTQRSKGITGRPHITACSSTGLSRHKRDVPLAFVVLYHVLLAIPHRDKKAMELLLEKGGEDFTVVRCSLFMGEGETETKIREGIEDPVKGVESAAIGGHQCLSTMSDLTPDTLPPPDPSNTTTTTTTSSSLTGIPPHPSKPRSCVVCRSRKVRCDKRLPCSNCRRANIACVAATSDDRPPRWARRLDRLVAAPAAVAPGQPAQTPDPATVQVMERLRGLERLVKELGGQLQAQQGTPSGSPPNAAPSPDGGRATTSASPSSGFWSRVSDELDALKHDSQGLPLADSDASDDDMDFPGDGSSTTRESHRGGPERNGLLFGHNLLTSPGHDLAAFRPLPSQVPFLISVFNENVNFGLQIVHAPALDRLARAARTAPPASPSDDALLFAVYYAAVTSMEDADVLASFGAPKADLNYRFRLGLEHALARADFVRLPDLALVQAFVIFLALARRHDSPRYVWMMAGLAIRMGQAIGLHRDGARLAHLSPFEAEIRRRVWWCLVLLDIRASEDQGTEFTIAPGSFDTRMPLSLNDGDIYPTMTELPAERQGDSDMIFALGSYYTARYSRLIMAARSPDGTPDVAEQSRLLDAFRTELGSWGAPNESADNNTFTPAPAADDIRAMAFWTYTIVTRLVFSKLALFIHLPSLFSSSDALTSGRTRDRLLIAALEASRRPWSPLIERSWVALHSRWLIPAQPKSDRSARVWIPLRRLMARARRHRAAELRRLAADPGAVEHTRALDAAIPVPGSPASFSGSGEEVLVGHCPPVIPAAFSGPDFTSGAWDGTGATFEDFGDLDMDMTMDDGVDWNDWLNSAAVMECPGMEGSSGGT
ncbi:fungal-specific transcription factor domain-containing protein [Plectosphaerella plurivora]|uniref:Fungal-specific transcription factor domain-containing protein n=1 Tax=Plectosphaerella plurivora TaxID=936078 RepID=A0A9P8V1V6_9PEZI|nr:fungal-specific transcription factor domain-containing protein [Plectosphaerella plurivora]